MQVSEALNEGLKREIKIVVPASDMKDKLEAKLKDLKGRVKLNGFRDGKVPISHLRKLYGKSAMAEIVQEMGKTGFSILDVENLRWHYAKTLEYWVENYELNVKKVREMFDEAFVRQWRLFLNGSIAGFRDGDSRLFQVLFSNGINSELPPTRAHVYRDYNWV